MATLDVAALTNLAAEEFGTGFRYSDEFSQRWVENKLGFSRRSRGYNKTVQESFSAVWTALDERFPERQITWPVWPAARDLVSVDIGNLKRMRLLDRTIVPNIYSQKVCRMATRDSFSDDVLFKRLSIILGAASTAIRA